MAERVFVSSSLKLLLEPCKLRNKRANISTYAKGYPLDRGNKRSLASGLTSVRVMFGPRNRIFKQVRVSKVMVDIHDLAYRLHFFRRMWMLKFRTTTSLLQTMP